MKQYLEVGKITNTHGIKGELKLELWCDGIDYIRQFKTLYTDDRGNAALTLISARPQKNTAILKFAEINSVEQAQTYKNKILFGNRDDAEIDENANYIQDLIGCYVVDINTEEEYGRVEDVVNYGASDILDIESGGKHSYVPLIPDIVKEINTDYQVIKILPMKGLFDED